jgi:hypothetical protein
MVTLDEAAEALRSVLRIARFDRAGAAGFGSDMAACRQSFWAFVIGLPAILLLIGIQVIGIKTDTPELLTAAQLIAETVQIAGFPLLLIPVLRGFGRADRWARFVTGYNWFSLGVTVLQVAALGLAIGLPDAAFRAVLGAVYIYSLVVEAFLADAVLEIGGLRATAIVLLDVLFSLVVGMSADWIGGGA